MKIETVAQNSVEIGANFQASSSPPAAALLLDQITQQQPPPDNPRRNGKIARLPKATRRMINQMLDDGLPYRVIIDELGEAGADLNAQNLTNWVQGGYQDYLKHQDAIQRANAQFEFAADFLRQTGNPDPALLQRALNLIASTQMFTAIMEHGQEALSSMLQANPATFLTLLNTLCRITDSGLKLEAFCRFQGAIAASPALPAEQKPVATPVSTAVVSGQFKPNQAPSNLGQKDLPTRAHNIPAANQPPRNLVAVSNFGPAQAPAFKLNQADSRPTQQTQRFCNGSGPLGRPRRFFDNLISQHTGPERAHYDSGAFATLHRFYNSFARC